MPIPRDLLARTRERLELALGMLILGVGATVLLLGFAVLMSTLFGWWSVGIVLGGALWVLGSVLSDGGS